MKTQKQEYIIFQIRQLNLNYATASAYFPISSSVTGYFQALSPQMILEVSWMAVNVAFAVFMKHRKMKVLIVIFREEKIIIFYCSIVLFITILLMMQILSLCMCLSLISNCYYLWTHCCDIFTCHVVSMVSSRVQHALSLLDAYFKII